MTHQACNLEIAIQIHGYKIRMLRISVFGYWIMKPIFNFWSLDLQLIYKFVDQDSSRIITNEIIILNTI